MLLRTVIDAYVADVWVREANHLVFVGRVRHNLLVAGHRRVEHNLRHFHAWGSEAAPGEDGAVS